MTDIHLYIVRHGETEWNVEGRIQGHRDSTLTPRGEEQARAAGRRLAGIAFDRVYVSVSGRTRRTFELMAGSWTQIPPVTMTEEIREIRHGLWEGKTGEEAASLTPDLLEAYRTRPHLFPGAPGGESLRDVRTRVFGFLGRAVKDARPGSNLLLVTHGVTTKVILITAAGEPLQRFWAPPRIESGSISVVAAGDEGFRIVALPDDASLPES